MARLVRVRPGDDPGFRRVRSGSGFRYVDARGTAAAAGRSRADPRSRHPARLGGRLDRGRSAWRTSRRSASTTPGGVSTCTTRAGASAATAASSRGRSSSPRRFRTPAGRVTTALRRDDLDRERVLAASFRLLDEAAPRIGSARYLDQHGSRGLTTLQRRDASVAASVDHAVVSRARAASAHSSRSTTRSSPR